LTEKKSVKVKIQLLIFFDFLLNWKNETSERNIKTSNCVENFLVQKKFRKFQLEKFQSNNLLWIWRECRKLNFSKTKYIIRTWFIVKFHKSYNFLKNEKVLRVFFCCFFFTRIQASWNVPNCFLLFFLVLYIHFILPSWYDICLVRCAMVVTKNISRQGKKYSFKDKCWKQI